jgi:large subunit ribosomal protein L3
MTNQVARTSIIDEKVMKFILAKKLEMSQVYADNGHVVPVTLVQAGPCVVTQVKGQEKDGYSAVQVGFLNAKRLNQPLEGHLKDLPKLRVLQEFRLEEIGELKRGDIIEAAQFEKGETVDVTGVSKGRGFAGVVKRHGFKGGPASHGHKDQLRMPGSIGSGGVQKVFKGKKMAGHMGDSQVTVKNLQIVEIRDGGVLAIKGAVPGARNSILKIKTV